VAPALDDQHTRFRSTGMTAEVPVFPTFKEDALRGLYANEMNVIETPKETIVDFSLLSPSEYYFDEEGRPAANMSHEIVGRFFLPAGTFRQFVSSYLRNHPEILEGLRQSAETEEQ
jgi:hypothetical protein